MRIWRPEDRLQVQLALESARRTPEPVVLETEARTDTGAAMNLEIMLTPLKGPSGEIDRVMGFYQPTTPVAALMGRTVSGLMLKAVRVAGVETTPAAPRLRLATVDGRRITASPA